MTKFGKIFCNLVANFKGVQLQGCSCLRSALPLARARSAPTMLTEQTIGGYGILPYPRRHQIIFPQKPQNPQNFLTQDFLPQIADVHRLGGYGILPYPRSQPNHLPTEATEPTEVSDARYSPTDCGCAQIRRVWHPAIPTQTPNYLPTEATEPTEVSDARYSPTEHTEHTETTGARYSPTDCTDVHRLGGYGIPAIPTQPTKLSSHRTLRSLTICVHL